MYGMLLCHPKLPQLHIQNVATGFIEAVQNLSNYIILKRKLNVQQSHSFAQHLTRRGNNDLLVVL